MGKKRTLNDLLKDNEHAVLEVLEKHGVFFDAGTYLTMNATPERAAAWHAVPDVKAFLKDLAKVTKK